MFQRNYGDIIGGGVMASIGAFTAIYSITSLEQGTGYQMGPGMFPSALGIILVLLGFATIAGALFRPGERPPSDIRTMLIVLVAIFAFAMILRPFGMLPAVIAMTLIVTKASNKLTLLGALILSVILALCASLIFGVLLRMPITIIAWPW